MSSAIQWQRHQLSAIVAAHPPAWSVGSCWQYVTLFGICHKGTSVAARSHFFWQHAQWPWLVLKLFRSESKTHCSTCRWDLDQKRSKVYVTKPRNGCPSVSIIATVTAQCSQDINIRYYWQFTSNTLNRFENIGVLNYCQEKTKVSTNTALVIIIQLLFLSFKFTLKLLTLLFMTITQLLQLAVHLPLMISLSLHQLCHSNTATHQ